ncbi:TIGR03767 family metallophosphoesterase [Streptomyces sp. NPDC096152]|uniref:TIGR03767 family metallophosphoesterase n=1 Tax=Streptomyces sp. NPDC096152 TaxID=3366078 RepID=UPI00381CF083
MSRTRSVATTATLHRRALLAAGAASLTAGVGLALRPEESRAAGDPNHGEVPVAHSRQAPAAPLAPYTKGTTLATAAAARNSSGYRRLGDGPGWSRVVRSELAAPKAGRAGRRTTLAAFVQLTDLHVMDSQHPLRTEFLQAASPRSWRPQEALTVQGAISLVERVNTLRGAPVTGSPLEFVITTGDNTDNNSRIELDWYLKILSGGRITPDSGDPRHYEGAMSSGLSQYWQPGSTVRDQYKQRGFPHMESFLHAATREVRSPGLNLPWYSTVGNHDSILVGCFGHGDSYLTEFATGDRKLFTVTAAEARKLQQNIKDGSDPKGRSLRDLLKSHTRAMRRVAPDHRRALFTPAEYVKAHLDPAHSGPGPVGHGYTQANLAEGTQYYSFRVSDHVVGISLDTTDPQGNFSGSIGAAQMSWLEHTLNAHKNEYAIVFSHYTSTSMSTPRPDPARPNEKRCNGDELLALLGRHRNVVAWVNGHVHRNTITPHTGSGGRSFWEISTASHVDFPQLARVIELVDNKDGTLSLHTTLVESAAPHRTDFTDLSQTGLAALYRELAFNAHEGSLTPHSDPRDRNTELMLKKG